MEPNTPPPAGPPLETLWLTLFSSSLVFGIALIVIALLLDREPFAPAWRDATLFLTGLSVLPSILMRRHWRGRLTARRPDTEGQSFPPLHMQLVLGLALADLPALAGFFHYLATGELFVPVAGCVATVVIGYLYRPTTGLRA